MSEPRGIPVAAYAAAAVLVIAASAGCQDARRRFLADHGTRTPPRATGGAPAAADERPNLTADQAFDLQFALARTLERQGDLDRAEAAYRALRQSHPDDPHVAHRLAVILDRQGRFDESMVLFQQAVARAPADPILLGDLGYSLYRQRRWAEAETVLRKAIATDPGDRRAHNHLGLVLCQTDRRDAAVAEFRRAGCSDAEAQANLGLVLAVNDRYDDARRHYAAVASAPMSPERRAQAGRIEHLLAQADAGGGRVEPSESPRQAEVTLTGGTPGDSTPVVPASGEEGRTPPSPGRARVFGAE